MKGLAKLVFCMCLILLCYWGPHKMPKMISDEHIYNAVIKTISERGFRGASTRLMAKNAGISEITLFRKYGTKVGLVKNAVRYLLDTNNIKSAFQCTGDIHADLVRIVDVYQDMVRHYGHFLVVLITEVARFDELRDIIEIPLELEGDFSKMIVTYQQKGVLREEPIQRALSSLIGPLMYEGLRYNTMNNAEFFHIDSDIFVDKYLKGRLNFS